MTGASGQRTGTSSPRPAKDCTHDPSTCLALTATLALSLFVVPGADARTVHQHSRTVFQNEAVLWQPQQAALGKSGMVPAAKARVVRLNQGLAFMMS